jgi:predicted nucleotidyltransferase component of viral defense system
MLQILKDIYTDTSIAPFLGFKGGTAVYLFYKLERFSVDLDFDLLDQTKKDAVFDKITAILKNYGQLKDARQKRYSLFFLLSYRDRCNPCVFLRTRSVIPVKPDQLFL